MTYEHKKGSIIYVETYEHQHTTYVTLTIRPFAIKPLNISILLINNDQDSF